MKISELCGHVVFVLLQFLVESLHSRHVTALRCTPDQSSEALHEEAAHQRELALDILSHVAHVFDFPDLNRFLNVTSTSHYQICHDQPMM